MVEMITEDLRVFGYAPDAFLDIGEHEILMNCGYNFFKIC